MQLISIGKSSTNRIVISDARISSYHAEILLGDDGSIFITDRGSTNGTTVRGQKIQAETEVSVNRGDKVTFAGVADLDWSRIPTITSPPPGWQIYSVGSGLRNRIQLNDPSGQVSRYHATLKIDPKGKIFINDHSSNGTFVNNVRIPSGQDTPVKRKDHVSFANTAALNWDLLKKTSSSSSWKYIAAGIAAVLIIGAGILGYTQGWFNSKWSVGKTYDTYANSIVCVYHEYQIVATTYDKGKRLQFVLNVDDEGNVLDIAPKGTAKAAQFTKSCEGTAFFVDKEGTLATNRHLTIPWEDLVTNKSMVGLQRFIIYNAETMVEGETVYIGIIGNKSFISRSTDFEECSILKKKTDIVNKDIGLLQVKNKKQLPAKFTPVSLNEAVLDSKEIAIGQPVYLMGYPLGLQMFLMTSAGTTNTYEAKLTSQAGAISQIPDVYKFGHNAVTFGGSSGSPIFNDKGQLIGIHNSGLSGAGIGGFSWGILARHAKELYERDN